MPHESYAEAPDIAEALSQITDDKSIITPKTLLMARELDATMCLESDPGRADSNFQSIFAQDGYEGGARLCRPHEAFPSTQPRVTSFGLPLRCNATTDQVAKATSRIFDGEKDIIDRLGNIIDKIKEVSVSSDLNTIYDKYGSQEIYKQLAQQYNADQSTLPFKESLINLDQQESGNAWGLQRSIQYALAFFLRGLIAPSYWAAATIPDILMYENGAQFYKKLLSASSAFIRLDSKYTFQIHEISFMWIIETARQIGIQVMEHDCSLVRNYSQLMYYISSAIDALSYNLCEKFDERYIVDLQQYVGQFMDAKVKKVDSNMIYQIYEKMSMKSISGAVAQIMGLSERVEEYIDNSLRQSNIQNCFYCTLQFAEKLKPFTLRAIVSLTNFAQYIYDNDHLQYILATLQGSQTILPKEYIDDIKTNLNESFKKIIPYLEKLLSKYQEANNNIQTADQAAQYIIQNFKDAILDMCEQVNDFVLDIDDLNKYGILISEHQFQNQKQEIAERITIMQNILGIIYHLAHKYNIQDLKQQFTKEYKYTYNVSNYQQFFRDQFEDNILYQNFSHAHFIKKSRQQEVRFCEYIEDTMAVFTEKDDESWKEFTKFKTFKELYNSKPRKTYITVIDQNGVIIDAFPAYRKGKALIGPKRHLQQYIEGQHKFIELKDITQPFILFNPDSENTIGRYLMYFVFLGGEFFQSKLETQLKQHNLQLENAQILHSQPRFIGKVKGEIDHVMYYNMGRVSIILSDVTKKMDRTSAVDFMFNYLKDKRDLPEFVDKAIRTYFNPKNVQKMADPGERQAQILQYYQEKCEIMRKFNQTATLQLDGYRLYYSGDVQGVVLGFELQPGE